MQKFERTEFATSGKSDYEQIKGIRNNYAHFGMKIAFQSQRKSSKKNLIAKFG